MSLFEHTNPRELKELLGQVHRGEAVLPDFQRDFVWDPNATQELILSIASNYPAGSLLRIRNTQNLFAAREIQGAPALSRQPAIYLILDGQQRMTSLYQAFYGVGEHRYFLNLRKLIDGADFEECLFHLRANTKPAKRLQDRDAQLRDLVLPLSELRNGTGTFTKWSKAARKAAPTPEEGDLLDDQLDAIHDRWFQTIDDYRFPVVTLSDQTDAEAVCTIFETLNRTGVKLSPFELLTARFWPKNVNLRHLWTETKERHPIIADYDVDPYYLLQAVSLVSRSTPGCKRGEVLDLEADAITTWWHRCAAGLETGLEILRDDCGVLTKDWLPMYPVLVTLSAVLGKEGKPTGPQEAVVRQSLARWFWCATLSGKYDSSPNGQSVKDYVELQAWFGGGTPPDSVTMFRFDPLVLRDTTFRQRAIYKCLVCVVLRRRPRDFHSGAPLTSDLIGDGHIDDHHIFPQAYLEATKPDSTPRQRDCVLNRTLIDRTTNIRIGKRPPSQYLGDIRMALGDRFDDLLRSHLLPTGPDSPLWWDNFDDFLAWREAAYWNEIQTLTGLTEATEIVDDEDEEVPA